MSGWTSASRSSRSHSRTVASSVVPSTLTLRRSDSTSSVVASTPRSEAIRVSSTSSHASSSSLPRDSRASRPLPRALLERASRARSRARRPRADSGRSMTGSGGAVGAGGASGPAVSTPWRRRRLRWRDGVGRPGRATVEVLARQPRPGRRLTVEGAGVAAPAGEVHAVGDGPREDDDPDDDVDPDVLHADHPTTLQRRPPPHGILPRAERASARGSGLDHRTEPVVEWVGRRSARAHGVRARVPRPRVWARRWADRVTLSPLVVRRSRPSRCAGTATTPTTATPRPVMTSIATTRSAM